MAKKKDILTIEQLMEQALVPKSEQPYEIPEGWEWVRLGMISSKIVDGAHHTPRYTETGINFISVKDINNNLINYKNTRFISLSTHNELIKRCNPEFDDVLITKSGTIGRTAVVTEDIPFSLFVSVALIKNYKNIIKSTFLSKSLENYINSINIQSSFKGAVIKNFHLVDLRKLPIPLPPLEVQQEIVKKLESMLSKIKEAKELIKEAKETFKNRKASILHKAFTGELTKEWRNEDADSAFESLRHRKPDTEALEVSKPQTVMEMLQGIIDDSNTPPSRASGIAKKKGAKSIEEMLVPEDEHPYEIPEGWEWVKLGSIINLISGQDISAINCNDKKIGTPYILGASNITNNIFTPTRWIESPKIISVKNDILVSVKGTIGELYLQKEEKINISRQIMAIRMISNDIHLSYINYFLVFYVKQLQEKSRGVIPGLAREDILKTDLPLPPLEEQKQIVKILESLLEKEEKALSLLKMEKDLELLEKSILAKAFRGELTGNTDHTRTSRASVSASGETAMELLERVLREKHSLPPKATTGKTCKDAAPLRLKTTDSTLNEKPKNNTPKKTSGKNDIKPLKKNKEGKLF